MLKLLKLQDRLETRLANLSSVSRFSQGILRQCSTLSLSFCDISLSPPFYSPTSCLSLPPFLSLSRSLSLSPSLSLSLSLSLSKRLLMHDGLRGVRRQAPPSNVSAYDESPKGEFEQRLASLSLFCSLSLSLSLPWALSSPVVYVS